MPYREEHCDKCELQVHERLEPRGLSGSEDLLVVGKAAVLEAEMEKLRMETGQLKGVRLDYFQLCKVKRSEKKTEKNLDIVSMYVEGF